MLTKLVEVHLTQVFHLHLLCWVNDWRGWIEETIPKFKSDQVPHVLADGHTLMLRVVLNCLLAHHRGAVLGGSVPARATRHLEINCGWRRILDVVMFPRRISISRLHLLVKPSINHQSDILLQRDMYRGWPRLQLPLIAI